MGAGASSNGVHTKSLNCTLQLPGGNETEVEWDDTPSPMSRTASNAASNASDASPRSPSVSPKRFRWKPADSALVEGFAADDLPPSCMSSSGMDDFGFGAKARRQAVSDAPMDMDLDGLYQKTVYEKDSKTIEGIRRLFQESSSLDMFANLKGDYFMDVANALYKKEFALGEEIIMQGEEGDCLYIIEDGSVDVFVFDKDVGDKGESGKGPKVATLGKGSAFGELALMYNCPRSATCKAASQAVSVWALDDTDFKMLIIQGRQEQLMRTEGWLKGVELFRNLSATELSTLAEALKVHNFRKDTVVLRQGDVGDRFFVLAEGAVAAYIDGDEGEKEVKVYKNQGDYFGEVALLQATKRKATIRCLEDSVAMSISKKHFEKLLGPSRDKLDRTAGDYPKYLEFPSPMKKKKPWSE